jgi:nucleoside-diphosphate-sugar epimerase
VYGPRERPEKLYFKLISYIFQGREFPLFEGSEHHLRSYTYVADAIDGLVAALDNFYTGEIFNIGTDVTLTTKEAMRTVEEVIGKPARIVRVPRRAGDQLKTHANIEKARRLLGYDPTTTLREGVEKMVEWYEQYIFGRIDQ